MSKPTKHIGAFLIGGNKPSTVMLRAERRFQFPPIIKHIFIAEIDRIHRRDIVIIRNMRRNRIRLNRFLIAIDGNRSNIAIVSKPCLTAQFILVGHMNRQSDHIAHVAFADLDVDEFLRAQLAVRTMRGRVDIVRLRL